MPPAVAAAAVAAAATVAGTQINASSQRRSSRDQAASAQAAIDFAREQEAERRREFDVQQAAAAAAHAAHQRRIRAIFGELPTDSTGWKAAGGSNVSVTEPPAQAYLGGAGAGAGPRGMLDDPGAGSPPPVAPPAAASRANLGTLLGLPQPPRPSQPVPGLPTPELPDATARPRTLGDLVRRKPYGTL